MIANTAGGVSFDTDDETELISRVWTTARTGWPKRTLHGSGPPGAHPADRRGYRRDSAEHDREVDGDHQTDRYGRFTHASRRPPASRAIRDGEYSPTEVVDDTLERIHDRNDRTNAFVTVTDDLAREMAAEADRAIDDGEPLGPLHGVPVAIRISTTSRSPDNLRLPALRGPRRRVGFAVRRPAREAGAIVVGKTNTPEFGLGTTTDNRVAGPTGTPFDPDRVSGGSSGGAGAALGDRLVPRTRL